MPMSQIRYLSLKSVQYFFKATQPVRHIINTWSYTWHSEDFCPWKGSTIRRVRQKSVPSWTGYSVTQAVTLQDLLSLMGEGHMKTIWVSSLGHIKAVNTGALSTGSPTPSEPMRSQRPEKERIVLNQLIWWQIKKHPILVTPVMPECHPRNHPLWSKETKMQSEGVLLTKVADALSSSGCPKWEAETVHLSDTASNPTFTDRWPPDPSKH